MDAKTKKVLSNNPLECRSVLTIPNKINFGIELEMEYSDSSQVKFLYSNFKLNDGYKKSVELSKKYNLYRQDYCGCIYSKRGE